MTKRKLLKYFKETPTDLRNLIFSFISMEGEKYDKVYDKHSKAEYNYINNRRKIQNYHSKERIIKFELMCLEVLKKDTKKLKQLKDRLERYEKFRSKLSQSSAKLRTRMEEALKEKKAYLKLEKYLRKKYYKNKRLTQNPHFYSLVYMSNDKDNDTDSE